VSVAANGGGISFGPNVDGFVLTEPLMATFRRGGHHRIPSIVATAADEFALLIGSIFPQPVATAADYDAELDQLFGASFATQLRSQYPLSSFADPMAALSAIFGDAVYTCPARVIARAMSSVDPQSVHRSIYSHVFHRGPLTPYGAAHGFDLFMTFQNLPAALGFDLDASERSLSDAMARRIVRFAANADPATDQDVSWSLYRTADDDYLSYEIPTAMKARFHSAHCDFWDPYLL
jgi:para-nitrobenzyl esterase